MMIWTRLSYSERWKRGFKVFAFIPTRMSDNKTWVWLDWYWSARREGPGFVMHIYKSLDRNEVVPWLDRR